MDIVETSSHVKHRLIWKVDGLKTTRIHEKPRITSIIKEAFLPIGFPATVSNDYITYQLMDSLQAFFSGITGLLATRAYLRGIGVGDSTAETTSAVLTFVYKDGGAALAKILFAARVGNVFDSDCKTWRFAADLFNDTGLLLELIAIQVPKRYFLPVTMLAQIFKAWCGVAAGATKANLSQHFAKAENVADLNAKESSQETLVGLIGMMVGSWLVKRIPDTTFSTWSAFLFFTVLHLLTNYIGISSCVFETLNRQRALILIREFMKSRKILSPEIVAGKERILWFSDNQRPKIRLGSSLSRLKITQQVLEEALEICKDEGYLLFVQNKDIHVILKDLCTQKDVLKGLAHAVFLQHRLQLIVAIPNLSSSLEKVNALFPQFWQGLQDQGWKDLDKPSLQAESWRLKISE